MEQTASQPPQCAQAPNNKKPVDVLHSAGRTSCLLVGHLLPCGLRYLDGSLLIAGANTKESPIHECQHRDAPVVVNVVRDLVQPFCRLAAPQGALFKRLALQERARMSNRSAYVAAMTWIVLSLRKRLGETLLLRELSPRMHRKKIFGEYVLRLPFMWVTIL